MKKILLSIVFLTFALNAFGAIPFNPKKDTIIVGNGTNAVNKEIVFDNGDGVSNASILVDKVLKFFGFNNDVQIAGDVKPSGNVVVGDGTDKDQKNVFTLPGGEEVGLRYNSTTKEVEQRIAIGKNWEKPGTGAGGAGGVNFNNAFTADDNGDAENGTTGWTAQGTAAFAVNTNDPLTIGGAGSFELNTVAQNDGVLSPKVDVNLDVLKGNSCEASIFYTGGSDSLSMVVVDNSNTPLTGVEVLALPKHTFAAKETIWFLCPSATDISGDANLANLGIRIYQAVVTDADLIKFGKTYIGTNTGLSETALPDTLVVRFESNGTPTTTVGQWWDSVNNDSTGLYTINYSSLNLTTIPVINATPSRAGASVVREVLGVTTSSATFEVRDTNAVLQNSGISLTLTKQGIDAKQTVQVYKSIPRIAENSNTFSAEVSDSGVVSNESADWINGNCPPPVNGISTCTYNAGLTDSALNCTTSINQQIVGMSSSIRESSSTGFLVQTFASSTALPSNRPYTITCQRGDGFKTPIDQPVIVGQIRNTFSEASTRAVYKESCSISGSAIALTEKMCNGWIESSSTPGAGRIAIDLSAKVANSEISCTCGSKPSYQATNNVRICSASFDSDTDATAIELLTEDASGNNQTSDVSVECTFIK